MKKILTVLLLLGAGPQTALFAQYEPPEGVEIKLELSLLQVGGTYAFELSGTSNLPEGTHLTARIFVLTVQETGTGEMKLDEERLLNNIPRRRPASHASFDIEGDGRISVRVHELEKKPFSIPYRGRVFYEPREQPSEKPQILARLGGKRFSAHADFRPGTNQDLAKELAAAAKELDDEIGQLTDLLNELEQKFDEIQKAGSHDEKAWAEWAEKWKGRVRRIRKRNEKRYNLWAIWMERQGKSRIEGFCADFDRMIQDLDKFLKGDKRALERARRKIQSFPERLEEMREVIGVDTPINPGEVRKLILKYEDHAQELEKLAESGARPGDSLKHGARKALLGLVRHLPRRGYRRVWELEQAFRSLFEACRVETSAEELRERVEAHRAKRKEFRDYAGLK